MFTIDSILYNIGGLDNQAGCKFNPFLILS